MMNLANKSHLVPSPPSSTITPPGVTKDHNHKVNMHRVKIVMQELYADLDKERAASSTLRTEISSLISSNEQLLNEKAALQSSVKHITQSYENEMEKVSNLQEIVVNLKDEASSDQVESQLNQLREEVMTSNMVIEDL